MKIFKKIARAIRNPRQGISSMLRKLPPSWLSDRAFIRYDFCHYMGRFPDLYHPVTFNEKLQWLKLHDRRPLYVELVDKYLAKEHARALLGDEFIIPTLGVWDSFDQIDFQTLPDQFVLKTTHDKGGEVIVRDKDRLDLPSARLKLQTHLARNYFYAHREWPYKNVRPRIIAEQYIHDPDHPQLTDYKFFCFDGRCRMILVCTDRDTRPRYGFFDTSFRQFPFSQGRPLGDRQVCPPPDLDRMIAIAERLSAGIPHVRIDLYSVQRRIYFGEYTFFTSAGSEAFDPPAWDATIGSWLSLPQELQESSEPSESSEFSESSEPPSFPTAESQ